MVLCYIGLGSNLGDRQQYIKSALSKVKSLPLTKVRKISNTIESEPIGGPVQGLYLNTVAEIETDLGPYQLLSELQNIESALGRVRTVLNGPRTIDLDILTYGDIRMEEQALCIPHPRILEREFVLVPLSQIAAHMVEKIKKINKHVKKSRPKIFKKVTTKAKCNKHKK